MADDNDARGSAPAAFVDLPNAELEVLACLWQKGQATAAEIREGLSHFRPMTHGAVATLLKRLEAKGLLCKAKGAFGKAFLYQPTLSPAPTYRRIMEDLRRRIFGGSGMAMVASLFETQPPSAEELRALEALVAQFREARGEAEERS